MATLAQLRLRAQEESDNVNSSFVGTSEWLSYINASYSELYGLLVQAYGNNYYVASPYSITTDGANYLYALPSDFFKLMGVELQVQSTNYWVTLRPFQFPERNNFAFYNSPIPASGQVVRLWYVPTLTALSADGDSTVTLLNGWEEYIVIDAAMKALAKEESDVSVLMARKQALIERINAEAENRDAGSPGRIGDVYGSRAQGMRYRLNGSNIWLYGGSTPGWYPAESALDLWGWW